MKLPRFPRCLLGLVLGFVLIVQADEPRVDPAAALPASAQIRNVQYGLLLRPQGANNADGTPLVLYPAQPWRCMTWTVETSAENNLVASLKNRFTSKTFAAAEGGVVKQTPFQADQRWRFEKLADGAWRILDLKDGRTLTARGENLLSFDDWRNAPEQKWEVLPAPAHLTM